MTAADAMLGGSPYQGYLYAYPHKTAYRAIAPALPLDALWQAENRDALFLYIHVPYCEMRCGFCNLFTTVGTRAASGSDGVLAYLDALGRQAAAVRQALDRAGGARFARLAIGGGTPTYLDAAELDGLFDVAEAVMGADCARIPVSVETSPETATAARLAVLMSRGVHRISIGVQSFVDDEVRAVGRAQSRAAVMAALERIRAAGVATLNIDLMYGLPGQSMTTWLGSIERALAFAPEELYLYPLYVRPLTGLGRSSRAAWDDQRLALYRAGRDLLLDRGYAQMSMRMFRLSRAPGDRDDSEGPVYRCQEDGMVGLGPGARSYTDAVHYATEYAVGGRTIKALLRDYAGRDPRDFGVADHGVRLDDDDRRRRFVILTLLGPGLDLDRYRMRFAGDAMEHVPELAALEPAGLAERRGAMLALTAAGVERSDAIGPWLCSARVRTLMSEYEPR